MKNKKTEANICMVISKTFSGLNMNALKYLLPLWISPLTGVTLRCTFAAIAFWIIGFFVPKENTTRKEKGILFLLGALGIYGFMFFYLTGLSKTTPVSSSIFSSLQPIWVFAIAVLFLGERITKMKIIGILIGLGGALLCISTQKSDDLASDAFTGNLLCLLSSMVYAVYLVLSNRLLKSSGTFTLLKYTFTGAYLGPTYTLAASRDTVVCTYIPYCRQLHVDSDRAQIFIYYSRGNLRLSYTYRSYDSLSFYRARPVQLDTDDCYLCDLYRCISGGNCREQR